MTPEQLRARPLTDLQYAALRAARDGAVHLTQTHWGVKMTVVIDRRDPTHDVTAQIRALRQVGLVRWRVVHENGQDLGFITATDEGLVRLREETCRRSRSR